MKARLIAKIGAGLAALLVAFIAAHEGYVPRVYHDPIGRLAACYGHDDQTLKIGTTYTQAECDDLLAGDLLEANKTVDRCIAVPLTPGQRAALISFAFNVGPGRVDKKDGLCVLKNGRQPQIRQRFNRGDYAGGCRALTEGWNSAGGKKLAGLVKRRAAERALCEGA